MKGKSCPYCGRRISDFKTFHNKKKGLFTCARCKKESLIKLDVRVFATFAAVFLAAVLVVFFWTRSEMYNTPIGIFAVIVLFGGFYFSAPLFIRYIPLKKNLKEEKENKGDIFETAPADDYVFNRDVFDRIKKNRNAMRQEQAQGNERLVPVIKDVSEGHASSDSPLKKVNKTPADRIVEEIIEENRVAEEVEEDIKTYTPKSKKPDGSRYTANRKL